MRCWAMVKESVVGAAGGQEQVDLVFLSDNLRFYPDRFARENAGDSYRTARRCTICTIRESPDRHAEEN